MVQVVIILKGGLVESVHSTEEIDYLVIDKDLGESDDEDEYMATLQTKTLFEKPTQVWVGNVYSPDSLISGNEFDNIVNAK
jgi:hypothetical protein